MAAYNILIIGESGTGKTTSIRNLNPEETAIINISSKPLPLKGWRKKYTPLNKSNPKGNLVNVKKKQGIKEAIKYFNQNRPEIKYIIIDDFQYMAVFEYFRTFEEDGWDKFTRIGLDIAEISQINLDCRDDLYLIYLMHVDEEVNPVTGEVKVKAKTIGKMVNKTLTLEGLFNIVLYTKVIMEFKDGEDIESPTYKFDTQNSGNNTCKTSLGLFKDRFVDNDLNMVIKEIEAFENAED